MNKMNEQIKQKQTNRYKEWTDGHQRGGGMGRLGEKGEGIKKYKLVFIKSSWGCKIQHRKYRE